MFLMLRQMSQISRLALPVGISRAGAYLLIMADTMMVGHFDTDQLAFMAMANAMVLIMFMTGTGMQIGTAVLTSQAIGARDREVLGQIWLASILFGFALGLISLVLCFIGDDIFIIIGQSPEISAGAAPILLISAAGLPGGLIFVGCTMFLEAMRRPLAGLVAMVLANLVNIFLNWLWIYSDYSWGDAGQAATAATSIVRWLAALFLVIYTLRQREVLDIILPQGLSGVFATMRKLRRLGYAFGAAQGMESIAFASLTFFAGYLGTRETATFAIVMNVIATCYMGAIGVTTATAVQVGQAVGAGAMADMRRAGWAGALVVTIYMGACALLIQIAAAPLAGLYTADATTFAAVVPALVISGMIYVPDGLQGVLMGALRGAGDVWLPTFLHLLAFLAVMVPATYYFAIIDGLGMTGLIYGTALGVATASIFLACRFYVYGQKHINRL
jgi:MATE family multidrug resistance protein